MVLKLINDVYIVLGLHYFILEVISLKLQYFNDYFYFSCQYFVIDENYFVQIFVTLECLCYLQRIVMHVVIL